MRITFGMMTGNAVSNLMTTSARLVEAQNQVTSGKRISKPSDDVSGTGLALNLRESVSALKQYQRNGNTASSQLKVAGSYLDNIVSSIQSVRQLTLQAANSTLTAEARANIAFQLDQINETLVSTANAQYNGKYIFAGSKSDAPPITANTIPNSIPYVYNGDSTDFNIQIAPWASVTTNINGNKIFNMGGMSITGTSDLFDTIKQLRSDIVSGDVHAISQKVTDITSHLNNVTALRSQAGAKLNRVESTGNMVLDSQNVFEDLLSKTEDVDLAQAVINLQTRQNVYQAAISATGKILALSLTDYMK